MPYCIPSQGLPPPWTTEGVSCDPRNVWKIWDDFKIEDSRMIGFWEDGCPVTTSSPDVKATVYIKKGKCLLSLGNYSDSPQDVSLNIDWRKLGIAPSKAKLRQPDVKVFQENKERSSKDTFTLEPRKGLLVYIEEK